MKVSVIIPSMKRPEQLRRCVERLIETTAGHDVEIVVVIETDPASVRAVEDLPITVIYREEHKGAIWGWNQGAYHATGDAFVLGADDVWWHNGWLDAALEALATLPGRSGMVGLNDTVFGPDQPARHFLVARDYVVTFWGGAFVCPHYRHHYVDAEATARARRDGRYVWAGKAVVEHRHWRFDKADKDEVYRMVDGRGPRERDRRVFERRLARGFPNDYKPIIQEVIIK